MTTPQTITVAALGTNVTRSFTIPARSPLPSQELGSWGLEGDFVIEVNCDSVCAAALTMWDRDYKIAHESPDSIGCRYK